MVFEQVRNKPKPYKHSKWLEAGNFGFIKYRNCTICLAKTKALISFAVTAKLICDFVLHRQTSGFSHEAAHIFSKVEFEGFQMMYISYDLMDNNKINNMAQNIGNN